MVGNIIYPNQFGSSGGLNPDDYFDPVTHIATEADFIRLLEAGIYDSSLIGYFVSLSNSGKYNDGLWIIADVNHDSTNTGQEDCYDLISVGLIVQSSLNTTAWDGSANNYLLTYYKNTLYPYFSSNFKPHILTPKFYSNGVWVQNDNIKITVPSATEIGGSGSGMPTEGVPYSIFTDDASRIKVYDDSLAKTWGTRSIKGSYNIWGVNTSGVITDVGDIWAYPYWPALMRVQ